MPAKRKREMRAYSKRHYGRARLKLTPKVIVEHIAVAPTAQSVINTFAPDHPDPELHELPNVCAHYLISEKNKILELVSPRIRCRHTVGLNHVAIGIEHIGYSDGDARQPQAPAREPEAHHLPALHVRDRDPQRHRPQREPEQPVPPRARQAATHADPRRLRREVDADRSPPRTTGVRGGGVTAYLIEVAVRSNAAFAELTTPATFLEISIGCVSHSHGMLGACSVMALSTSPHAVLRSAGR